MIDANFFFQKVISQCLKTIQKVSNVLFIFSNTVTHASFFDDVNRLKKSV